MYDTSFFRFTFVTLVLTFLSLGAMNAQGKYFTRSGTISFVSDALLEKNEAVNNKVSAAIEASTG